MKASDWDSVAFHPLIDPKGRAPCLSCRFRREERSRYRLRSIWLRPLFRMSILSFPEQRTAHFGRSGQRELPDTAIIRHGAAGRPGASRRSDAGSKLSAWGVFAAIFMVVSHSPGEVGFT